RYQLSKRTLVRLEVFNVLGQRVASLVNQSQDAGWYLTDWDGTDESGRPVASGTYFYRFVTDVITDTKSMVIIR
ncbi:MAG: gliding motility-associated C-terminal domain-containing protein, partial [Planctomycetes bacterium]|nr:gliding motility-associated C-terminal domain-containing protein [Planctomycetota bacterium]